MTNKDLLKEAIAEAKTIREAAIANAKEALEESLTPHLREMLSLKLQEMDELEETDNNGTNSQIDNEPTDIDHGNIVNEEEAEEEEAPEEDEENPEDEDEMQEEEEEDLDPNDPDFADKLKDLIRDIIAHESGEETSEEEEELPAPEGGMEGTEDGNQIDIDELLSELAEMDEDYGSEKAVSNSKEDTAYKFQSKNKRSDLEGINGDGVTPVAENEDLDEMIEQTPELWQVLVGIGSIVGASLGYAKWHTKAIAGELGDKMKKLAQSLDKSGSAAAGAISGTSTLAQSKDLQEALVAVKSLRNQLQEVNLLNAKLLYVNKVFKSNNLTESQKVNVIATFDKAETVREVKLVFETVSKNVVTKKPTAIKEHLSFASKATGNAQTTAPKEIISEVSDQVRRMQFLAGIKTN